MYSLFISLLESEPSEKGSILLGGITSVNNGLQSKTPIFTRDIEIFNLIEDAPFCYWESSQVIDLFTTGNKLHDLGFHACMGPDTGNNQRFLRLFWEVDPEDICPLKNWVFHPKGGPFSRFFQDVHLVIDWHDNGNSIARSGNMRNPSYFFRPGITWTRRTSRDLSVRAMPTGMIFSDKGPAIYQGLNDENHLLVLLAIMNTSFYRRLVGLQLGAATAAARSYEVGIIQRTPLPNMKPSETTQMADLAMQGYLGARNHSATDETTLVFHVPFLVRHLDNDSIQASIENCIRVQRDTVAGQNNVLEQIETKTAMLYEEISRTSLSILTQMDIQDAGIEKYGESRLLQDFLQWCLGLIFGRWDIRLATFRNAQQKNIGPFMELSPLQIGRLISNEMKCATEGNIIGVDEYLSKHFSQSKIITSKKAPVETSSYPVNVAWNGVLSVDSEAENGLLAELYAIIIFFWPNGLDEFHEVFKTFYGKSVEDFVVDPNYFFGFHIKRYSKSRRKAPIYWLLQTTQRNFSVWLYYHRLTADTIFQVLQEILDPKIALETQRLEDLQVSIRESERGARKAEEQRVAEQASFIEELNDFRQKLENVTALELKPDLNDGVLLNIAPLWELVPWKEAEKTWRELLKGKYEWSSIGKQLRERGLVK